MTISDAPFDLGKTTVQLRSGAWYGDELLTLSFPAAWRVKVVQPMPVSPLSEQGIRDRLRAPIGTSSLSELARGRKSAVIIVDDITRPTPTAFLASLAVDELAACGFDRSAITIVVAGGTHQVASKEDIERKIGPDLLAQVRVVAHDMRNAELHDLGLSEHGVPILVNRIVTQADLIVGIGGIYPHPAAGFSGGSKIVAPGVCGLQTARFLHDYMSQGNVRCRPENRLRGAADAVARKIGLDYVVNVVLNSDREIAGLFAGDMIAAHREGARFAMDRFALHESDDTAEPDILITDTYPFDLNMVFAVDRGFWPFAIAGAKTTKVAVAACPMGLGSHELDLTLWQRLHHRLRTFSVDEIARIPRRIRNLRRLLARTRLDFSLLSTGVTESDLTKTYPSARTFERWTALREELERKHPRSDVRVVVYRCAPLLVTTHGMAHSMGGAT